LKKANKIPKIASICPIQKMNIHLIKSVLIAETSFVIRSLTLDITSVSSGISVVRINYLKCFSYGFYTTF